MNIRVRVGRVPLTVTCPNCQAQVTTTITSDTSALQYISAGAICFFGFWLGCCLIPFCIDSWRDVTHYCPNCNAVIGKHPKYKNLYLASGFTGRGLMQAPGIGRALTELITTGSYQSIDLSALSVNRVLENKKSPEPYVL